YSRKELVGQHIELLIPERFHTRHSEYRKEYFKSPKPRHSAPGVDLTGLRRDGSEFTAEISLSPIATPQGNLVTAAVRDITERIRLEQEQYRKISEASRLKSEFLANMSHELRTPLNAIIGFASLIHSKKVGPLNDDQTDYMSDILTSSRHLLQLINDVLDLAKIEAGKMEFRSEPFDVVVKIDEVIDTLRALAAEKHIRISSNVAPDLTTVNIDPAKFKQVLYNYLSNAIKFTPENGSITVRAWREGNDWFRLEVEDTGIGIAPEDVARLFVEFQQLDASPTKRFGGTGLGLSLTKRIAEAQGGSVSVRSELGKGSTFGALLPLTMAHSDERPAPPPLPQINGARPLLVIEDDARDRDWLARMLANAGYPVEVAATGAEAIRLCNQKAFAAITLDLLLPDTSGWEVLREIRATPLNRQVPAIVVTLSRDQGLSSAFILQDYLVKPVEEHALLQSLKQAGVYPSDGVVLVVDNDLPTLELVTANLNQLGYRTVCKDSAEEALELVRNQPPRVIVLELLLPGMSGFQFLDELRSTLEGRQIPVIVWSTKDLTSEERLRLRDSAQAIVPRDSVGELVKQLSSLTGLQREQSSNLRGSV
ncbi:MAG TPA: response regulator, partial [Candidatus Binataceae bacterium]|nr:response regulator [Candidatus Binataceae bacterium]